MSVLCHRMSKVVFCLSLAAFFLACDRQKEPGVYISDNGKTIEEMRDGDVIVSINGHDVLKSDFKRCQHLQSELFRHVNARDANLDARTQGFIKANEQRIVPMLMQNELLRQAAVSSEISVSGDEVEEMAKTLLPLYGLKSRTVSDARKEIGGDAGDLIADTVKVEALSRKTVRSLAREGWFHVSSQEVTNQLDYVIKFNETADRMNRLARETLLKAKSEILGGKLFADVAAKYSEVHPEYGKEWQTVELGELVSDGEAQLRDWLATAEMGDISDPIDLDDGIAIIGVAMKGKGEVPEGMEPPMLYTLVRCTMFARQNMEMPTAEEAERLILDEKAAMARREVGIDLHNKAVIEFPNGTNFFATVERR